MEKEFKVACNMAGCRGVFRIKEGNYVCQICDNKISKEIQEKRIEDYMVRDHGGEVTKCWVCNIEIPDFKEAYWIGNIVRPVCDEHKNFETMPNSELAE